MMKFSSPSTFIIPAGGHVFSVIRCSAVRLKLKSRAGSAAAWRGKLRAVGPGILFAGAAIGVSHLVQSTRAGAGYGFALLWTLVFSTVACLVLQEAAARLTVVSGRNLGQALRMQYRHGASINREGRWADGQQLGERRQG